MTAADLDGLNRERLVARLLSATVHDTRNALQGISGTAELLMMGGSGPVAADKLRSIQRRAAWLAERLDELLRLQREKVPMLERVDVGRIWTGALALRQASWGRQRIAATHTIPHAVTVKADVELMTRILLNLVLNAEVSLAAAGGGEVRLVVVADGPLVSLTVSDTAGGVPAAEEAALFTSASSRGRLATGLVASRQLAELMGGTLLWLGPEQRASFQLRLPSGG